jgi:hypothetical protein
MPAKKAGDLNRSMTIREPITEILSGYAFAKSQSFSGHQLAKVVRTGLPSAVRAVIPEDRYLIEGSAGQGQWAEVPWVAVFDRLVTNMRPTPAYASWRDSPRAATDGSMSTRAYAPEVGAEGVA